MDQNDAFYDLRSLGGGLRVTATDTLDLTHEVCATHLALPSFSGERAPSPAHVAGLLSHMRRGTFHPEWVTLMVCRCKQECADVSGAARAADTVWRMNGQHTCHARLEMPPSYRCKVQMVRYLAETAYDMRMLYASIDRGKPRGRRHIYKSYLIGTEQFAQFGVKTLERVPSGLSHWLFGDTSFRGGRNRDADDIAYLMQTEHYKVSCEVMRFLDCHGDKDSQWVLRAGVIGAMFATFSKNANLASDFWNTVVTGVGFTSFSDPRNKLHRFLSTTSADGRSQNSNGVSRETYYRASIAAWNAWREGRELKALRIPDRRIEPK